MKSKLGLLWKRLSRWTLFRRLAVALPLLALAVWIVAADLSSDKAWPVAAFLTVGLLALVVPTDAWQRFLSRLENAQIGPVSFGLRQQVEAAAEIAPPSDQGEGAKGEVGKKIETAFDLRMQLEWKLTFIAKDLLPNGAGVTFVTIGSLFFDGYLTAAEAKTATGILDARQEELDKLPEAERRKFLEDARTFLEGLRATVFWGQVKRELEGRGDAGGDNLHPGRVRGTGGRNDLLAQDGDGETRVIPIFAVEPGSKKLEKAVKPIEEGKLPRPRTARNVIVVPDRSKTERSTDWGVEVIELKELRKKLQPA